MRILLAILMWLSAGATHLSLGRDFRFFEPVQPRRAFQVMVHRGSALQAPENTRQAILRSIEDGFEWVEVDVRLTRDGHHALFHDSKLDGKTNSAGPLRERSLEELMQLDAGSWFAPRYSGERLLTLKEW